LYIRSGKIYANIIKDKKTYIAIFMFILLLTIYQYKISNMNNYKIIETDSNA